MLIVVESPDRQNEGNLVITAEKADSGEEEIKLTCNLNFTNFE